MTSITSPRTAGARASHETERHRPKFALAGLVARGVLHQFAGSGIGTVMLVVLAIGFVALALLNVHDAITAGTPDDAHPKHRIADLGRAALYVSLTVAAVAIVTSGRSGSSSSQKSQTWTAQV